MDQIFLIDPHKEPAESALVFLGLVTLPFFLVLFALSYFVDIESTLNIALPFLISIGCGAWYLIRKVVWLSKYYQPVSPTEYLDPYCDWTRLDKALAENLAKRVFALLGIGFLLSTPGIWMVVNGEIFHWPVALSFLSSGLTLMGVQQAWKVLESIKDKNKLITH